MTPGILIIDDEADIAQLIADVAEELGFVTRITASPDRFRESYRLNPPAVIVVDLMMPQVDGVELLREMAADGCTAHVLVASGTDAKVLNTVARLGQTLGLSMLGTLQKPLLIEDLEALLARVLHERPTVSVDELRAAIDAGQLWVSFQPKVRLGADGGRRAIGAFEALARWQHPRLGAVSPDNFIPLAEDSGLIAGLTDFIAEETVRQLAEWRAIGLEMTGSVNISPYLLEDLSLPDRMAAMVRRHGIAPASVTLEITESGAMKDATRSMDILTRFRLKGFGLSIDDFGTGFSSLVQLYRMPFNEVKIDKSFVMDYGRNPESAVIIKAITDLGHGLGLEVCAEGVETQSSLDFLLTTGCEIAQGYFFSRPVPAAEFLALITREQSLGAIETSRPGMVTASEPGDTPAAGAGGPGNQDGGVRDGGVQDGGMKARRVVPPAPPCAPLRPSATCAAAE